MPAVSVIIPAYNAERFLRQTVVSVCAQTFGDWELIIVVDGKCVDNTEPLAWELAKTDPRIRVIVEGTRGVSANRNLGVKLSRGALICFLDSDDWWHPEKLLIQTEFMRNRGARISCTGYQCMAEDGITPLRQIGVPGVFGYQRMLFGNLIGCLTVMIDRSLLPESPFAEVGFEDYGLWLQLLRDGKTAHGIDRPLAYYRKVRHSYSANKLRAVRWRWLILREQERLSLFVAFLGTAVGAWRAAWRTLVFLPPVCPPKR